MRFILAAVTVASVATLASACSEPVPVSADGAVYLTTSQPDPLKCMIAGHSMAIGTIDATERTTVVTDGTDGNKVTCTILNDAAPYKVDATLDDGMGNYFQMAIPAISPSNDASSPVTGTGIFSAPWTAGNAYAGECKFWFSDKKESVVVSESSTGRIWVTFSCDALNNQQSTCPLKTGFAIFENCSTVAADS